MWKPTVCRSWEKQGEAGITALRSKDPLAEHNAEEGSRGCCCQIFKDRSEKHGQTVTAQAILERSCNFLLFKNLCENNTAACIYRCRTLIKTTGIYKLQVRGGKVNAKYILQKQWGGKKPKKGNNWSPCAKQQYSLVSLFLCLSGK